MAIEDFTEYCQRTLLLKDKRRLFSVFQVTSKRQGALRKLRIVTFPPSGFGADLSTRPVQRKMCIDQLRTRSLHFVLPKRA